MLTVSTFYWHDDSRKRDYKFRHDHIRTLKSMVERNLSVPHRFLCVTDDDIDGIETLPLDWAKHVPGTCFIRLCMRNPEFAKKMGERILNLDLDMVIVDNIDSIVDRPEESVWWHNPNFPQPGRAFYQTSIQLFTAGSHPELWTDFDPKETPKWVNNRFGGAEQAWVSERLPWTLPHWNAKDGIYGAGRMLTDQGVRTTLPQNAKIVSFPGNREPSQPEVQEQHLWVKEHYH